MAPMVIYFFLNVNTILLSMRNMKSSTLYNLDKIYHHDWTEASRVFRYERSDMIHSDLDFLILTLRPHSDFICVRPMNTGSPKCSSFMQRTHAPMLSSKSVSGYLLISLLYEWCGLLASLFCFKKWVEFWQSQL